LCDYTERKGIYGLRSVDESRSCFHVAKIFNDIHDMIWSKLKKNIENNFSETLKKRVRLHTTTYGSNYDVQDLYNRGWITVDGAEVVNFSTPETFFMYRRDLNVTTPTKYPANTLAKEHVGRTPNRLTEKGEFSKYDLTYSCSAYLNMSIVQAIKHESPIIQMLAVLDSRLGKRRLALLDAKALHPLVRYFLDLRLAAEGMKSKAEENSGY
jgi:hypothetical protein